MSWRLLYTKQARQDAKKLAAAGLKPQAEELLAVLAVDPFQSPPPFEKLVGDLRGACSRRINIHHRLVYEVQCRRARRQGVEDVDLLRVTRRMVEKTRLFATR